MPAVPAAIAAALDPDLEEAAGAEAHGRHAESSVEDDRGFFELAVASSLSVPRVEDGDWWRKMRRRRRRR
eukprot:751243-Hanusia_phi.AAC.1